MVARLHPGCPGTAARLPMPPGSQKPMPPASALAAAGANATADSAASPAKAAVHRRDGIECRVIARPLRAALSDKCDMDCLLLSTDCATCRGKLPMAVAQESRARSM